jgi:hypothetical protein
MLHTMLFDVTLNKLLWRYTQHIVGEMLCVRDDGATLRNSRWLRDAISCDVIVTLYFESFPHLLGIFKNIIGTPYK